MNSTKLGIVRAVVAGIALLSQGCSEGIQSYSDRPKGVDLKQYKTYAWIKPEDADLDKRKDDKIYAETIVTSVNAELEKKGFVLDTENPDAVFAFDTRIENRVSYSQTPTVSMGLGFGGPGYYGGFSAPVSGGQVVSQEYEQGMLFIQMFDTKTRKMVWRGWAEEKITYRNDIEADIRKAVKHIFMRLPVKHKE